MNFFFGGNSATGFSLIKIKPIIPNIAKPIPPIPRTNKWPS